ncbi:MAG: hypothetical protein H9W81_07745 [Enterococcus sp.]|nr:hypothetical protein [Enterococcus sp.]
MNKLRLLGTVGVASIVFGAVGTQVYSPEPETRTNCVVSEVATAYRSENQGGPRYYIKTENCGHFRTTEAIKNSVEVGKSYDFVIEGTFTWSKVITESSPVATETLVSGRNV